MVNSGLEKGCVSKLLCNCSWCRGRFIRGSGLGVRDEIWKSVGLEWMVDVQVDLLAFG